MTETSDSSAVPESSPGRRRSGGLSSMLLADLKSMAAQLGIPSAEGMRKAQLVAAIKEAQAAQATSDGPPREPDRGRSRAAAGGGRQGSGDPGDASRAPSNDGSGSGTDQAPAETGRADASGGRGAGRDADQEAQASGGSGGSSRRQDAGKGAGKQGSGKEGSGQQGSGQQGSGQQGSGQQGSGQQGSGQQGSGQQGSGKPGSGKQAAQKAESPKQDGAKGAGGQNDTDKGGSAPVGGASDARSDDGDEEGRSRNRRRRGRDRNRPGPAPAGGQRNEPDSTILEDDVLVPAAGILDVLDNYAFVRTSGYLAGADDVYLSLSMVRRFGLRRGDAVVGHVRQPREGERKEKFNPMVRIDSVNGFEPDTARERPEFSALTPVHPEDRLRLETGPGDLVGRMIDLAAPIGKGQRGLIASPPKAGKTTLLRSVAASISTNNPECHLMVVLLDERPEEVTDFRRSVKGEVIASTFDRPPSDHTSLAELAIDRAKRLVELGHDVVVLLDGLTRLGRAHHHTASAGGRVVAGGVDSTALHPPKRFFGAARNVEDGGSLTILATALVESGSRMDEAILEEFTGTANMELRLRADLAERQLFPAVDVVRSGTRHESLLMSEQEVAVVGGLRSSLADVAAVDALGSVLDRVRATQTNIELLMQLQRSGS